MVDQTSEPPTRTGYPNGVLQALVPALCERLRSTQLVLVETRAENATMREELAEKDEANADLTAQVALQAAREEALIAQFRQ